MGYGGFDGVPAEAQNRSNRSPRCGSAGWFRRPARRTQRESASGDRCCAEGYVRMLDGPTCV